LVIQLILNFGDSNETSLDSISYSLVTTPYMGTTMIF